MLSFVRNGIFALKNNRTTSFGLNFFCLLFVGLGILTTSLASAMSVEEIQAKVEDVLSSRHPSETDTWWRNLGDNAPSVLIKMYQSKTSTYHKMRLIDGLRAFKDHPEATEFLLKELTEQKQPAIRKNLIEAVVAQNSANGIESVLPFLNDEDPQVRFVTARALKKLGTPESLSTLSEYQKKEKLDWITKKLNNEPLPAKPLAIVSSSEDLALKQFSGRWNGYWMKNENGQLRPIPALFSASWSNRELTDVQIILKTENKKDLVISMASMSKKPENNSIKLKTALTETQKLAFQDTKSGFKLALTNSEWVLKIYSPQGLQKSIAIESAEQVLFTGLSEAK